MDLLTAAKERLGFFKHCYDEIVVVNPMSHQVLMSSEKQLSSCFAYFEKIHACENCIAMRATNTLETVHKYETRGDKILHVVASPVEYQGKLHIVELHKDVTKQFETMDGPVSGKRSMLDLVDDGNARIVRDGSTGAYNRHYIEDRLPVELYGAQIDGRALSLLVFEVDGYDEIVRDHGQDTMNRVLLELVALLNGSVRGDYDWVGRYRENQLMLILRQANFLATRKIADKLRSLVEAETFVIGGTPIEVTVTVGGAVNGDAVFGMDDMIDQSLAHLEEAREKGGNCSLVL
jgi:diguanylate cyclase (GGDEF)-like protein